MSQIDPQTVNVIVRFEAAVAAGNDEVAEQLVADLPERSAPSLRAMIHSQDLDRCWWGIRGLAAVGGADAVAAVVEALHHESPAIRAVAAMALGALHPRATDAVNQHLARLAALLADDDGMVRQAAADGLARCGDDAVDVLAQTLESEHEGVRVRAASALHHIGTMKTALPLYHRLDDPNPLVRHYAHETLTSLGLLANVLVTRG